jgi:hypothetical protein
MWMMMRRPRPLCGRLVKALLACALVGAVSFLGDGAGIADAAPVDQCTSTIGVIVAVDFGPWDGAIQRGCDPNPTTGYNALHNAGFPSSGTTHDGPAFICRINGFPTANQDACVVTPPASAYWSYWHANSGQDYWVFSRLGSTSYAPSPGSVDAWVYGATDIGGTTGGPRFSPAQVRAAAAAQPPAEQPPAEEPPAQPPAQPPVPESGEGVPEAGATGGSGRADGLGTTAAAAPATGPLASSSGLPTATGSAPDSTASPSTVDSASAPSGSSSTPSANGSGTSSKPSSDLRFVDAESTAEGSAHSPGSVVPVVVGGVLAAAVAAGGGWVAWSRRRQAE